MAIRKCEHCRNLMQEGYSLETNAAYYVYCSEACMWNEFDSNAPFIVDYEYHDWTQVEMDDEDFEILMNALRNDPTPQELANVFDILNREDASFYGPMGVLDRFITYLNEQEE